MKPIIINKPEFIEKEGCPAVTALLEIGENHYELWYCAEGIPLACRPESFLAATLLPAMKFGMPLQSDGTASQRLLGNITKIQDIYHAWDHNFKRVQVLIDGLKNAKETISQGVGSFFSGGVDSFYTLLKHYDEITHLIFVHGFDINLEDKRLRDRVVNSLREAATELKKPLIEIGTNLRTFSDKHVSWEWYHGAALASVALLLSPQFQKFYIPATFSYASLFPWGSHPILDPLWGTENMEIVHDGCEAKRLDKVKQIAECDTVLKSLRVCWENREGAYNCGQCGKCLRTMALLRVAGALERCSTFDRTLDLSAMARLKLDTKLRPYIKENLQAIERLGTDPQVVKALRNCLDGKYHRVVRKLARKIITKLGFIELV